MSRNLVLCDEGLKTGRRLGGEAFQVPSLIKTTWFGCGGQAVMSPGWDPEQRRIRDETPATIFHTDGESAQPAGKRDGEDNSMVLTPEGKR